MGNPRIRHAAIIAMALSVFASAPASAQPGAAHIEEARGIVKTFASALLAELKGALDAGGPVKAVDVCHSAAPAIAANAGASGWRVGRTALRIRNPANKPDAFEERVLGDFLAKAAGGTPIADLEHSEIVERDGGKVQRYMKAIPVGQPCLTCHGDVTPEVRAGIAKHYPQDRAVGFKLGELRGAFSLSRRLP